MIFKSSIYIVFIYIAVVSLNISADQSSDVNMYESMRRYAEMFGNNSDPATARKAQEKYAAEGDPTAIEYLRLQKISDDDKAEKAKLQKIEENKPMEYGFSEVVLNSPHGVYHVTKNGVNKIINVDGRYEGNSYKVESYIVKSKYSDFKKGEKAGDGWWYPSTQQFYVKGLEKATGGSHCEWWGDSNWSHSYKPVKLNIAGKMVNAFKENDSYQEDRVPERFCREYRFYSQSCQRVKCLSWEDARPDSYLVESEGTALYYYNNEVINK